MLEYSITKAGTWILFLKALKEKLGTGVALGMKWRILTVIGCGVWLGISPQNS